VNDALLNTQKSETKLALYESGEVFRRLFEGAEDPILLLRNGRIFDCNAATLRLFGYGSKKDFMDLRPSQISPKFQPDGRNSDEKAFDLIVITLREGHHVFEWVHRKNDDSTFLVMVTLTAITFGGEVILHALIRDVSAQKQLEEEKMILQQQLQHAQKLESLGVLAGGIAHDFNNILAVINGHCYMLKTDSENTGNHVTGIENAVARAAELCRQMLAYAGKAQLDKSQVNVASLVVDIVNMLKSTLNQNAVIRFDCSADIPYIEGDASQLSQIAMNLIINASESINEAQGQIFVSLANTNVEVGQTEKDHLGKTIPPARYLVLEVTDTGSGMDDETKQRIFEPFYTTKFMGRGLGMSAVLGIITAHNGALQLISQPGLGATFKIYLPVSKEFHKEEFPQQEPSVPWHGTGTILLVEDEEQTRLIVKNMLNKLGFTVIEASNGKEALEEYYTKASDITLVMTDLGMPIMDGYALFSELKKLNPQLPIIISSGFGNAVITSRIPSRDIAGLVSKPYSFELLREVLQRITGRGAASSAGSSCTDTIGQNAQMNAETV
jgi:PAS domain S-box-containing protein